MKVITYHSLNGIRHGLQLDYSSKKYIKVILIQDSGLSVTRLPITEQQYIKEMPDYGVARAKRHLRHFAKARHGGLRGVSRAVREAIR